MIRIITADSSALVRSTLKDIITKSKKLEWLTEATSFEELKEIIETKHPDAVILNKNLLAQHRSFSINEYSSKTNIPSIIYVDENDKDRPNIKNIKFLDMPNFLSFSAKKVDAYADFLTQQIMDVKCSILFENHPVTANCSEDGTIELPLKNIKSKIAGKKFEAVLVGVSTGGPATLATLIKGIGKNYPIPILITQHIDSFFDKNLITWLNQETQVPVHLAENNIQPIAGHVYFAPSDVHLTVARNVFGTFNLVLNHDAPLNFLRPSVDKMLESAANVLGGNCIAVILTGMGADGALGCRHLKELGAYTIAQDKNSSVIYGMPKAAYEAGGTCEILPLDKIPERLWSLTDKKREDEK